MSVKPPFWFLFCFGYLGQLFTCLKCGMNGKVVRWFFLQHILGLFLNICSARSQQLLQLSVLFPSYKCGRKSPEHKEMQELAQFHPMHFLPQESLMPPESEKYHRTFNLLSLKYTDSGKRIYLR